MRKTNKNDLVKKDIEEALIRLYDVEKSVHKEIRSVQKILSGMKQINRNEHSTSSPEHINASKRWYENNREYARQKRHEYYMKNREKSKMQSKLYYIEHRDEIRAKYKKSKNSN